ncbi:hypothetical protein AVEN_168734-1 [Araneus ventricosus]|uniref:Uncharacterized protein n=1 Tax=Araneus ventricosus TaxID=182803 RepID=A0A4Y2KS26_ARAVE|nr:hypothetical protein AVEN_262787-1 [Araneus ventricosus]GBN04444.1 hypothetical protein AVEN_36479-1 [Araneus ventricosus]GBN04457.1 hypothetical protein AVEN_58267-1 [Araneus ventricosus]GBN04477.1 hypothetical protein AVEN_168734-1 [Araneus ventricosus]
MSGRNARSGDGVWSQRGRVRAWPLLIIVIKGLRVISRTRLPHKQSSFVTRERPFLWRTLFFGQWKIYTLMDGGAPIRIADITRADPTLMEYASSSVALSPLLSQEKFRLETSPGRMSTFSGIMPACKQDKSRTRRTRSEFPT